MPELARIKYEFCDYDEAHGALKTWVRSSPPNVADYPTFVIDHIDINPNNENDLTLWLKLKET